MTVHVETLPTADTDTDKMQIRVTTRDAKNHEREYQIGIGTEKLDGKHLMHGRRIDENAPNEPAGGGPSKLAYRAARKRFEAAGYEVY